MQLGLAGFHIAHLGAQELVPLAYLGIFLDGAHVHIAQSLDFAAHLGHLAAQLGPALKRHAQLLRGGERQLVFFPELCHRLLVLGVLLLLLLGQAGDLTSQRLALVRDLAHPRRLLSDAAFLFHAAAHRSGLGLFPLFDLVPAARNGCADGLDLRGALGVLGRQRLDVCGKLSCPRVALIRAALQLGNGRAVALDILLSGQRLQFQVGKLVRKARARFQEGVVAAGDGAQFLLQRGAVPCKHLHLGSGVRPRLFARRDLRGKLGALGGKHFPRGPRLGQRGGDAPAFHLAADLVAPRGDGLALGGGQLGGKRVHLSLRPVGFFLRGVPLLFQRRGIRLLG